MHRMSVSTSLAALHHSVSGFLLVACGSLVACGDPTGDPSAGADASSVATCGTGGEHVVLAGAVALDSASAGTITVDGKVGGINGRSTIGRFYALNLRDIVGGGNLDSVGDHDIAMLPLKYIDKAPDVDCSQPSACRGFFALAGTWTVIETLPRYRASFVLSDLYRHDDTTNQLGAAMAGTVTGCVDANRL